MKGQFFVFAAIVLILTIISAKSLMVSINSIPILDVTSVDRMVENVGTEFKNILLFKDYDSFVDHVTDFSKKIRNDNDFKVLWILCKYNETFNISVGNFLGEKIDGNLSLVGLSPSLVSFSLDSGSVSNYTFTKTSDSVSITISYTFSGGNRKETIVLDASRPFIYGFFDVSLKSGNYEFRKIYTKKVIIT